MHHTAQQNFILVNLCGEKTRSKTKFLSTLTTKLPDKMLRICEKVIGKERKKTYPSAFVSVIICILIFEKKCRFHRTLMCSRNPRAFKT